MHSFSFYNEMFYRVFVNVAISSSKEYSFSIIITFLNMFISYLIFFFQLNHLQYI